MPHPCCYMQVHQWMKCILGASGFMSNRGRQNVASFLALDMGLEAWPCCDRAETDVTILLHFFSWIWTYRAPEKCYESRVDLTQSLPHKQPMFNAFDFQQTTKSRFDSRQKTLQDWRQGADWFESFLVDYDVASNWGSLPSRSAFECIWMLTPLSQHERHSSMRWLNFPQFACVRC